ncbi:MAG: 23S rRNA (pseudouridine(1915)-N(3))-methyltransferase RlmH [Oscillospiraceae bacterium]|nr:23S rRNA (pseudouridine(1915)-N(3))-methyltransferase RlmH [Oscillospiraceae bacterium]
MMNVDLICVGKLNAAYCAAGVAEYQKRLSGMCKFRIVELPEETIHEKNASQTVIDRALEKEGAAILAQVKKGAALVALCVEGKQLSSEELAGYLDRQAVGGCGDVAFVIGSSHGLAPAVKQAAALRFSMGRITLPHQLARLVLCEQIYRAFSINAGTKYHK